MLSDLMSKLARAREGRSACRPISADRDRNDGFRLSARRAIPERNPNRNFRHGLFLGRGAQVQGGPARAFM
jgi:hypothetical protein